jgi:hypothetical protein
MMSHAIMKMFLTAAFLLVTASTFAQDAPASEQTTQPVVSKPKGPQTCEWKSGDKLSFETTLTSGEKARALRCGDYQLAAQIVQTDAFDFSERKSFTYPVTYVLFNLSNHSNDPVELESDQFQLIVDKRSFKPLDSFTLATRVQNGEADVDFSKGANVSRSIFGTTPTAMVMNQTAAERKRNQEQAKHINEIGLRRLTLPQNSNATMGVFFVAQGKKKTTLKWTAPSGDTFIIPAPESAQ